MITFSSSFNKCIPLSRVFSHWKLYTCGQVSNFPFTIKKLSRNVQLKTKKWKLWKAGVCQAMTEDVNGA